MKISDLDITCREILKRELLLRRLKSEGISHKQQVKAPTERADRSQPLPLSFAQQRVWFLDQLEGAGAAYHIPGALRLRGLLDQSALQSTLDTLIVRHEILRTSFVSNDGSPVQVIAEEAYFALTVIDLSALPSEESKVEARRQGAEEVQTPFDLCRGPLIRGRLIRLADDEHLLFVTMHHIISDGWSMGILIREVGTLYAAYHQGRSNPLPPLAIQYADYAQWQRNWLVGDMLQVQLDYWKQQLNGAPVLLELPSDHPRPPVQSYAGASVRFVLSPELSDGIRALAKRHDVTLYMVLYAGWGILLSKLSGQNDIVIGTPVANRQRSEFEGLIGFFVNTLVLRTDVSDNPRVSELLAQIKNMTLTAYSHQDVPFEQVVEAVQPTRTLSHSPLFQSMLVLQNMPLEALQLSELTLTPLEITRTTAQFDLTLALTEMGEEIAGELEYASDLFDRETIERWIERFQIVLTSMIENAELRIGELNWFSAAERRQVLEEFNATTVEYPKDKLIHELFEEQVKKNPEAVAVVFEGDRLTYAELNRRSNQLAHHLIAQGVKPDTLVAICVERSLEMVVGLLGILKAGGAYVPLDPSYPQERLAFMLGDANPKILLTQARLKASLPATHARVITLDGDCSEIAGQMNSNLEPQLFELTSQHLAYVIYTSGSTGMPKGVMVEHGNVVRLFSATEDWFHFDHQDVWTLFHSFAFDFSVWELWGALLYGGRLVIVSYLTTRSPQAFYNLLCHEHVTVLNQTPTAFLQLIPVQGKEKSKHALRLVIFGGEVLEPHMLRPWIERNGTQRPQLINMYGITEATVHVTYRRLMQEETKTKHDRTVGRPIPDLRVYILDGYGQLVPIGVSGEIYIGGVGVARGYLNRPQLTLERFIVDPFSKDAGARLYKTGDLGRWKSGNSIEYLGRNDHQVKIRGFRIELGEIEAQLVQYPQVKEAVVLAREDNPGDKRLVAYLTLVTIKNASNSPEFSIDELRTYLKSVLPEYMVPSAFVMLKALPLTPNGKLDRKALPAPGHSALPTQVYEAPQGEIEEALAGIWQDILNVERVGRYDNFFGLGGHSLLAVKLLSRVRDRMGIPITILDLFRHPSVCDLVQFIKSCPSYILSPVEHIPNTSNTNLVLPVSGIQKSRVYRYRIDPMSTLPNIIAPLLIEGDLNQDCLQEALNILIRRHEALRTIFSLEVDGAKQIILHDFTQKLVFLDLSSFGEYLHTVSRVLEIEQNYVFDLEKGPLIRFHLLRLTNKSHLFLINVHHIIFDGASLAIFLEELTLAYDTLIEKRPLELPLRELNYIDFTWWERHFMKTDCAREQMTYWQETLRGVVPVKWPSKLSNEKNQHSVNGSSTQFCLMPELNRAIRSVAQTIGVTYFTVLFTMFSIALRKLTGLNDFVICVPVANRNMFDASSIIGYFAQIAPVRIIQDTNTISASRLVTIGQALASAQANQNIPYMDILAALEQEFDFYDLRRVTCALSYDIELPEMRSGLRLHVWNQESRGIAEEDLTLFVDIRHDEISVKFEYRSSALLDSDVQTLTHHFLQCGYQLINMKLNDEIG